MVGNRLEEDSDKAKVNYSFSKIEVPLNYMFQTQIKLSWTKSLNNRFKYNNTNNFTAINICNSPPLLLRELTLCFEQWKDIGKAANSWENLKTMQLRGIKGIEGKYSCTLFSN